MASPSRPRFITVTSTIPPTQGNELRINPANIVSYLTNGKEGSVIRRVDGSVIECAESLEKIDQMIEAEYD